MRRQRDAAPDPTGLAARIDRTLPDLLLERARTRPAAVAFRDKQQGIYRGYSWSEFLALVEETALGLKELGVQKGDRVAVMGDPCPEWLVTDHAIMAIGAITVGIYATSATVEVEHILSDSEANVVVLETQEHLDKLLPILDRLPGIRRFVVIDTRALFMFTHPKYLSFEELRRMGARRKAGTPDELARDVAGVRPDDLATILYTSGTTAKSKGVMVSHRTLLAAGESYINCQPELRTRPHRMVAHLPLAHGVGRSVTSVLFLQVELVPFFCEEIEDFTETIREVAPNFALLPPRFWEKFAAQLLIGVETSSPIKRAAYEAAAWVGRRVVRLRYADRPIPIHLRVAYWGARQLVFRHLLEKVGLGEMKIAFTGSAPMPPQVTRVWHLWGVDLREMYGLTECLAISIAQFHPFPEPGDIGLPASLDSFEFRLAPDGEILLRSPAVCQGYWNQPELARQTITADGWLHTGDVAELTERGAVKLVDRRQDIMITAGGKTLSPQQIEKALKGSPYVAEAIAIGEGRRYVTALLMLDYATVSEWARAHKVPYTSYTNLVTRPEVLRLVDTEIAKANELLARVEQVKYYRIIPQELDPEEGETTPNYKIKRKLMAEMFAELIESMYESETRELFDKAVTV